MEFIRIDCNCFWGVDTFDWKTIFDLEFLLVVWVAVCSSVCVLSDLVNFGCFDALMQILDCCKVFLLGCLKIWFYSKGLVNFWRFQSASVHKASLICSFVHHFCAWEGLFTCSRFSIASWSILIVLIHFFLKSIERNEWISFFIKSCCYFEALLSNLIIKKDFSFFAVENPFVSQTFIFWRRVNFEFIKLNVRIRFASEIHNEKSIFACADTFSVDISKDKSH